MSIRTEKNRILATRKEIAKTRGSKTSILTLEMMLKRRRELSSLGALVALVYQGEYGTPFGRLLELVTMEIIDQLEQL